LAITVVCLTTVCYTIRVEVLCEKLLLEFCEVNNLVTSTSARLLHRKDRVGVHGEGETPDPIPNSAVKPFSGYNTWVLALGK
jgi:hypothetical protein